MNENELAELDLAVAKAEGWAEVANIPGLLVMGPVTMGAAGYRPTRDPVEAMYLMQKYELCVSNDKDGWFVHRDWLKFRDGSTLAACEPTPAIAICRAVVALKQRQE